jgi:hypothetical protein
MYKISSKGINAKPETLEELKKNIRHTRQDTFIENDFLKRTSIVQK